MTGMKILVLNADAIHLGYLGCYGSEWVATPALDRLAAEGVVFDRHYADSLSEPRSSWTGEYRFPSPQPIEPAPAGSSDLRAQLEAADIPFVHVSDPGPLTGPDAEEGTPLELTLVTALSAVEGLAAAGRWLVWVDLPSLRPPWEVGQAFLDRYFTESPAEESDEEEEAEAEEDEEDVTSEGDEEDEPEPLTPLLDLPPGPIDVTDITLLERLQTTYAAAVTQLDAGLGVLVGELREQGVLEDLAVVVTADRGLPLGEHGVAGEHRPWLHEERVHLPLLLRLPGGAEAGLRVSALTQPVDLLPTLLDLLGQPGPPSHGRSLLPLVRGEKEQVRAYACSGLELGEGLEWALRTPEWAFLLPLHTPPGDPPRGPQLYVKPDDRWEVNNVVQHRLEFAERLEQTLRAFVEATRRPGPLQAPELPAEQEASEAEGGASKGGEG
jgi:arylsulfatase A-like enzyme